MPSARHRQRPKGHLKDVNRTMDATRLIEMIHTLRAPGGCPWDQKQQLEDLRPYLIEEAHEAAAAMDRYVDSTHKSGDQQAVAEAAADLCAELGDLQFQVCFVIDLASDQGAFEPQDVIERVHAKMVERHPHVYGDAVLETASDVARAWADRKAKKDPDQSVLAGVPDSLPALTAAFRIGQKAAGIGFDWPEIEPVRAKLDEELRELDEALADTSEAGGDGNRAAVEEELGDVLLTISSLARHLDIDPERALARANLKFRRRFQQIEHELKGQDLEAAERLWQKAKQQTC